MYVLWQDAQFNSTLVKEGYRLTPLRAAFAMAVAARRRTGLSGKDLISAKNRALGRQLYGKKGTRGTVVDHGLFLQDLEDTDTDTEGAAKSPMSPTPLLSTPSPTFASAGKEKAWMASPTEDMDMEIRPLARSDTDLSVNVLSDEELRKRYLRGVEEARLSRKPLSREATLVGEGLWERNHEDDTRDRDDEPSASGNGYPRGKEGEPADTSKDTREGKSGKDRGWRNRLKKVRRPG